MDISTQIDHAEGRISGDMEVWEMNHANLKEVHTFGDDRKVRPTTKKVSVDVSGNGIRYTFPKHSLTILKLRPRS